ncbi:MAG: amino acid carrier protein [Planctomycetota bacterium]
MRFVNDSLVLIDSYVGSAAWFPYALLGTGLFFTIYLKFPQVRFFAHAVRIVRGKYDKHDLPGDTSHWQALATALSGTVGTGNIAGVAFAVHLGGPAALFWMLITAAVGMCTKFVEVSLSHKYREKSDDGTMSGGPMYYMKNAKFTLGGKAVQLKWLAVIFALATILSSFGSGSMPQINSISSTLDATFGINKMLSGAVLSVLLALVIIGGISRIAAVTSKLVPTMAVIYFVGAISVVFANIENVIPSIASIFTGIFSGSAATGGFLGANLAFAFNKGVGRGLFSNEAGQGSAPIAHASAKANEPLSEGMVAILEPFIDTIVICTVTGLVLLSSGVWAEKHENTFDFAEIQIVQGLLDEADESDKESLYKHLNGVESLPLFSGELNVTDGKIQAESTSFLHARSLAEDVMVYSVDSEGAEAAFTGEITIEEGSVADDASLSFTGKSLVHSAPLTAIAFNRGFLGDYGQYIISIGLLLFAFSTAISWSYYGDRAMTFLFGSNSVVFYRIVYVIAFFLASFQDTKIIWTLASITVALMTLPNLIGILWLRRDMKETISEYGEFFEDNFPDQKHPNFK